LHSPPLVSLLRSSYSFLFYGYSLSDRDLLQSMDDMMESFGSEIGPHFWITAQEIEAERAEYLLAHYAIHTIQVKPDNFVAQAALLEQLCRDGWTQPEGHAFVSAEFAIAWKATDGATQSCALRTTPLDVPKGVALDISKLPGLPAERYVALGINLRRNADGGLLPGSMLNACSKFAELDWTLDKPFAATGGVLERSVKCATRTAAMEAAGACAA
jgi:SIR2-like domain